MKTYKSPVSFRYSVYRMFIMPLECLYDKVCNFFYWGWRMRGRYWWDYDFLLQTIGDYLELMERGFRESLEQDECMSHIGQDKTVRELMVCKNLCRRIVENDYCSHQDANVEIDWLKEGGFNGNTDLEDRLLIAGHKHRESLRGYDIKLLTKLMNKHILTWWH